MDENKATQDTASDLNGSSASGKSDSGKSAGGCGPKCCGAHGCGPSQADATSGDDVEVCCSQGSESEVMPDPLTQAQAEVTRLRDQLMRTAADFDNFRKRSRRENTDAERRAREDMLRDLLPVFDNLERATAHVGQATDVKSLAEGITMVMRGFIDTLSKIGVERVEAVGKAFDPAVHEAIQQLETADLDPGTVAVEIQAGYKMGERLVRPSLVVVAKRPAASA